MVAMIVVAQPADWPQVREIRLSSLREAPEAYGSAYEVEVAFTDAMWRQRLGSARTFLALGATGEAVGTVTALGSEGGEVLLVAMYVAPVARGTGCAQELIDAVVQDAEQRGAARVVLRVTDGNDRAARCYTRYGFVPTGARTPRAGRPELIEVEYALALDQPGRVSVPG